MRYARKAYIDVYKRQTLSVCFIGDDTAEAEKELQNIIHDDINVEDAVSAKIKGTDAPNDLAVVAVQKSDIPKDTLSEIKIAQIDVYKRQR